MSNPITNTIIEEAKKEFEILFEKLDWGVTVTDGDEYNNEPDEEIKDRIWQFIESLLIKQEKESKNYKDYRMYKLAVKEISEMVSNIDNPYDNPDFYDERQAPFNQAINKILSSLKKGSNE